MSYEVEQNNIGVALSDDIFEGYPALRPGVLVPISKQD